MLINENLKFFKEAPKAISKENLAFFVERLKGVVALERGCKVNMFSIEEPVCGTPGCHAGLIYLALRAHLEFPYRYAFDKAAEVLAQFLLGPYEKNPSELYGEPLRRYAGDNHEWWGNISGRFMFSSGIAFGMEVDTFESKVILNHWEGVLERTP